VDEYNLATTLAPHNVLDVLRNYLLRVANGKNLLQREQLDDQTLRGYLTAAALTAAYLTGRPCCVMDPTTLHSTRPALHPYLRDVIQQRAAWKEPKLKKEPVTMPIIDAVRDATLEIARAHGATASFVSMEYAVYDWERVVIYTGSRIAEYGQTSNATSPKSSGSKRYTRVPMSTSAGKWAGMPIAFIASDFTFWDRHMCQIEASLCLQADATDLIFEVHVRFRFDKSKNNFSIRKFRRQKQIKFDIIVALVNIFRRAAILRIPAHEPIGQYRQRNGHVICLRDKDVRNVLRAACIRAYPDPSHYCRIHIAGIVAHSNRVTAALCLYLGGASIDEIAFRLRWEPGSVPTYLRECFVGIDAIMQKAIAGAYLTI
jgi:hypothetical protein